MSHSINHIKMDTPGSDFRTWESTNPNQQDIPDP